MDLNGLSLIFVIFMTSASIFAAERAEFLSFIDRYWEWRLEQSPEFATKAGTSLYADRLQQLTEETFRRNRDTAQMYLDEVTGLLPGSESKKESRILRVIRATLDGYIRGYKFRKYSQFNFVSPFDYPYSDWSKIFGLMSLTYAQDYENLLSRYVAVESQLDQMITLMRLAIQQNSTQFSTAGTGTDEKLEDLIAAIEDKTSLFHKHFLRMPTTIELQAASNLTQRAHRIISSVVYPALKRFQQFLTEWFLMLSAFFIKIFSSKSSDIYLEYEPNTRPLPGSSSLPGGLEFYHECLRWHLGQPLTPDQVHQTGLQEVERIKNLMEQIEVEDNYNGTLKEYLTYLKAQPENYYSTEEAMIEGYTDIIQNAQENLHKVLYKPDRDCQVIVKQNMNPQSWASYSSPPKDGSKPGVFNINVFNPHTRPKYGMPSLTLHETVPGHHSMTCAELANEDETTKALTIEFRKYYAVPFNFPFFTAFSEGWALYAEGLGEEMGIYTEPHSLLGRYSGELFRAARLVVDTGIHAFGWSRDQAVDYLAENSHRSRSDLFNEVNRYISWPGQACSYKIGELKIKDLRKKAERELGSVFDVREFHKVVLDLGSAPLSLLEEVIDEWITDTLESSTSSAITTSTSVCNALALAALMFLSTFRNI